MQQRVQSHVVKAPKTKKGPPARLIFKLIRQSDTLLHSRLNFIVRHVEVACLQLSEYFILNGSASGLIEQSQPLCHAMYVAEAILAQGKFVVLEIIDHILRQLHVQQTLVSHFHHIVDRVRCKAARGCLRKGGGC